jgi:hypothetical protein
MFTFGLVNKPKGNENPATEKWRLCWGCPCLVGLAYFLPLLYCMFILFCDIFLCKFGMTVLFVMYELLDISIACVLGGLL